VPSTAFCDNRGVRQPTDAFYDNLTI